MSPISRTQGSWRPALALLLGVPPPHTHPTATETRFSHSLTDQPDQPPPHRLWPRASPAGGRQEALGSPSSCGAPPGHSFSACSLLRPVQVSLNNLIHGPVPGARQVAVTVPSPLGSPGQTPSLLPLHLTVAGLTAVEAAWPAQVSWARSRAQPCLERGRGGSKEWHLALARCPGERGTVPCPQPQSQATGFLMPQGCSGPGGQGH